MSNVQQLLRENEPVKIDNDKFICLKCKKEFRTLLNLNNHLFNSPVSCTKKTTSNDVLKSRLYQLADDYEKIKCYLDNERVSVSNRLTDLITLKNNLLSVKKTIEEQRNLLSLGDIETIIGGIRRILYNIRYGCHFIDDPIMSEEEMSIPYEEYPDDELSSNISRCSRIRY